MVKPFRQVDVFCSSPFSGNPVAVVGDAEGLSDEQMRAISRWTNLSECTFLLPPTQAGADYRVRIFSLDTELSFAGHPTLGTARAWLDMGGQPQQPGLVVQECGVGLVPVRDDGERLAFRAPALRRSGSVDPELREVLTRALGLTEAQVVDAAWVDNGPGWVGVLVDSAKTVLSLSPDFSVVEGEEHSFIGVVGPQPEGTDTDFELRAFFPDDTGALREDPITGSLNASVAQWLTSTGRATAPYVASQGTALQRRGRVYVDADGDDIWVGGNTALTISGSIQS